MRAYIYAFANTILLAWCLLCGFFLGAWFDDPVRGEEITSIINTSPNGGTCSSGSCTLIRR